MRQIDSIEKSPRCSGPKLGLAAGLAALCLAALLFGLGKLTSVQAVPRDNSGTAATHLFLAASSPVYGGEFHCGLTNEPVSLDPAAGGNHVLQGQIFDGLLAFDEDLHVIPVIAASWETGDAQTFTFTLRTEVYFHNGRRLTAYDVAYSWERLNEGIIARIEPIDATTLRVTLEYPKIQWLYDLPDVRYSVIPSETVGTIDQHPVGTGPFQFDGWAPGEAITLTANAGYYAGRPYLDKVVFHFYADEVAMFNAFQAGDLDWSAVPPEELEGLGGHPDLIVLEPTGFDAIWMALALTPTDQVLVRRALNYAIDRPTILSAIHATVPGYYQQADGLVPPGLQGYDPALANTYPYSPALALELLHDAGYTDTAPGDGILDDGMGNDLSIELWTNAGNMARETAASLISSQWRDIGGTGMGLSVTTVITDWETFLDGIFGKTVPSFVMGWSRIYEPYYVFDIFRSGTFFNFGYSDPQVDAWLDQTMTTINLAQRQSLYQQIEDKILGDAPILPLWRGSRAYIKGPCANGLVVLSNGDLLLENVYRCGVYMPVVLR